MNTGSKDTPAKEAPAKGPVATQIEARLRLALNPTHMHIVNDSEKHRGHGGYDAQGGESHFTVELVSTAFIGKNRVARQRMVNEALKDLLAEKIHALSIRTFAPGE